MKQFAFCLYISIIFYFTGISLADEVSELKKTVEKQQRQIDEQRKIIDALAEKVTALEVKDFRALPEEEHILEKEWFRRLDISGFGAAGFLWTGKDASRPKGGFLNYEASLFLDIDIWEDLSFFTELQTVRLGDENTKWVRTAEVYAHFKNVLKDIGDDLLGIKAGRMDIPIGEEYLWQDAIDNPLITYSVSWPYGWDEGLLLYGKLGKLGWISSVMDGSDVRGSDDTKDKAFNLKLYGNITDPLYLSASFMRNGKAAQSAIEFAGSHFEPVGRGGHSSTLGTSPSTMVESYLYELDAKYNFNNKGYLFLNFGQAFVDDEDNRFDRDFLYFTVEPRYNISDRLYLISRFSAIGTFDSAKGYHFDGKPYAGGNSDFGYDAKSLMRWAVGLGFWLNPRTVLKLEYSRDDFQVIDASQKNDSDEDRDLLGAQVTVKF